MRAISIIAGAASLAGCSALDPDEVKNCEERLIRGLKSPSTYKAINKSTILISDKTKKYQSVSIEYDAQNSYGALLRDTFHCVYPVDRTGVRTDLGTGDENELGDALDGRGYFSPAADLPTRAERQAEFDAEIANIVNRID